MKEQINNKIVEIIKYIIDKPVEQITYNEYCILDAKLKDIQFKEDTSKNNKELQELMGKVMTNSISTFPATPLVPEKE